MMNSLLTNNLISSFVTEATDAPHLFEDLSNIEKYISETYKRRSIIELIQNADDAEATSFGIHKTSFGFAICNNGREFDEHDLIALCRSGASNKKRGKGTIGYRGIGFKSVANLSSTIILMSGDLEICFNKDLTKQLIGLTSEVPLIRIPHKFENLRIREELNNLKKEFSYTTIFAFVNVDLETTYKEIDSFDITSLIFLNNINQVIIDINNNIMLYKREFKLNSNNYIVKISDNKNYMSEWMIFKTLAGNSVALKFQDKKIISANINESVFHSFMPTLEHTGALIKINGDFSTDPSRKNIDLDTTSKEVLNDISSLLVTLIHKTIVGSIVLPGFYTPFEKKSHEYLSEAGNILISQIVLMLKEIKLEGYTFDKFRIKPSWLDYNDFEVLCSNDLYPLPRKFIETYPNSSFFLERIGIKTLSLKDIINVINKKEISIRGYSQIVTKIISTYYYEQSSDAMDIIKSLYLFPTKNGIVNANELSNIKELDLQFINYLLSNLDKNDIVDFFESLSFKNVSQVLFGEIENKSESSVLISSPKIFKWRRAEQNLAEYIRKCYGVKDVIDVSLSNVGYDLEIVFENKANAYIEVKSVGYLGEPIKMTNNEYTCAHKYQDLYFLALVENSEDFKVVFIKNPISTLTLHKQCERWSWFCQDFGANQLDINNFIKLNL